MMGCRSRLAALALALLALVAPTACASTAPAWTMAPTEVVTLPRPDTVGAVTLEAALAGRRSVGNLADTALSAEEIGQLLWAAQGITSPEGKRTAPSAGALYPLELYVLTGADLWRYLPDGHRVERRPAPDWRAGLTRAAYGQAVVGRSPTLVVVAAEPDRTRVKYGERATAFADREAGHAVQNLLLQATALGLAAVPVGGVDGPSAARVLALSPGQTVLYLVPVGRAA